MALENEKEEEKHVPTAWDVGIEWCMSSVYNKIDVVLNNLEHLKQYVVMQDEREWGKGSFELPHIFT